MESKAQSASGPTSRQQHQQLKEQQDPVEEQEPKEQSRLPPINTSQRRVSLTLEDLPSRPKPGLKGRHRSAGAAVEEEESADTFDSSAADSSSGLKGRDHSLEASSLTLDDLPPPGISSLNLGGDLPGPLIHRGSSSSSAERASLSLDDLLGSPRQRGSRHQRGSGASERRSTGSKRSSNTSSSEGGRSSSGLNRSSNSSLRLRTSRRTSQALPAQSASLFSQTSLASIFLGLEIDDKRLVGRDEEIKILRDALKRVETSKTESGWGRSEAIFVSGRAGTGKTALVNQIALRATTPVTKPSQTSITLRGPKNNNHTNTASETIGNLFCSGKFDQEMGDMQHRMPFRAFQSAFSLLVNKVMCLRSKDRASFDAIMEQLQASFPGPTEREAIQTVVPNIETLLNYEQSIEEAMMKGGAKSDSFAAPVRNARPHSKRESSSFTAPPPRRDSSGGAISGQFDGGRSQKVLYFLVRRFLRSISVCAHKGHPVVLVLDDLQWADQSSLDLLLNLATDRQSQGIILIGCYRSDEVTEILSGCIDVIERNEILPVTKLEISNLTVSDIQEFLEDVLNMDGVMVLELAMVVHKKTLGNAFFVKQFIMFLHDDDMLTYDTSTMAWQFDADKIESEMSLADNVADLMTDKIRNKLPDEARDVLRMASCIGSTFDKETVVIAVHGLKTREAKLEKKDLPSMKDVEAMMDKYLKWCVREGLLEPVHKNDDNNKQYRFAHDHVQIAAYSLISESQKGLLQLHMGEILQGHDNCVFVVADLWNRGLEFVPPSAFAKRMSLAELNLKAGKKAISGSAFSPALSYLRAAIAVLRRLGPPSEYWASHRELCLDLFGCAADAAFCEGHLEEMQDYVDEVIAQDSLSFLDKLRAYSTQIHSLGTQSKLLEAIDTSVYVLGELGIKMTTKVSKLAVLRDMIKTKRLLDKYDANDLLDLPPMEDEAMIATMGIMDTVIAYTYAANQDLMVLLINKMTRRTVKYGLSKYSPSAFCRLGVLTGGVLGDLKKGNVYAEVGLKLNKRMQLKEMEARTIFIAYGFVLHWNDPLPLSFKPYLHGYECGLETGDVEFAMFCITYHCDVAMHTGRPLSRVVADYEAYTQQMKDYEMEYNYQISIVPWQFALNLMGSCDNPLVLTGSAMEQEAMLAAGKQVPFLRSITCAARMWLAYYFGDYDLAWSMVEATQDLPKTNMGQSVVWRSALFEGLTAIALANRTGKKIWRKRAAKVMGQIKVWISKGNLNCVHIMHILKAEKAALDGRDFAEVRECFDLAIASARRVGFLNDQALANERAGVYCVSAASGQEGTFWASHYLQGAHALYMEWEAFGKTEQLERAYPDSLSDLNNERVKN